MPLSESDLMAAARGLTRSVGRSDPVALKRLVGGRNNRVFRVAMASGPPLFLKSYFSDPRDRRKRLAAEWSFLTYAWRKGLRVIPEPLAADRENQLGLYTFIAGRKLEAGEVSRAHVEAAADFLLAVNAPPRDLGSMPAGSEACFSLAQHIAVIERRVGQLGTVDPNVPYRDEMERFVSTVLTPIWRQVRSRIERKAAFLGFALEEELSAENIILSPSDFGFQNALVCDDDIVFTDFEYAGRDDVAKLVCDFFCQPDVPVPLEHYESFVSKVVGGLGFAPLHQERCHLILDAYRVKWICILLNDFRLVGAAQRAFARGDSWAKRCAAQLVKAEAKIAEVSR